MPWLLIITLIGVVLRFGVDGYNLVGDILIIVGLALTLVSWFLIAVVFGAVIKANKSVFDTPRTRVSQQRGRRGRSRF